MNNNLLADHIFNHKVITDKLNKLRKAILFVREGGVDSLPLGLVFTDLMVFIRKNGIEYSKDIFVYCYYCSAFIFKGKGSLLFSFLGINLTFGSLLLMIIIWILIKFFLLFYFFKGEEQSSIKGENLKSQVESNRPLFLRNQSVRGNLVSSKKNQKIIINRSLASSSMDISQQPRIGVIKRSFHSSRPIRNNDWFEFIKDCLSCFNSSDETNTMDSNTPSQSADSPSQGVTSNQPSETTPLRSDSRQQTPYNSSALPSGLGVRPGEGGDSSVKNPDYPPGLGFTPEEQGATSRINNPNNAATAVSSRNANLPDPVVRLTLKKVPETAPVEQSVTVGSTNTTHPSPHGESSKNKPSWITLSKPIEDKTPASLTVPNTNTDPVNNEPEAGITPPSIE